MLTKIEEFLFGSNKAHDLLELEKHSTFWLMKIIPNEEYEQVKSFKFSESKLEYEELLIENLSELEYPLPIIGFDCKEIQSDCWQFCLNAQDIEWTFTSKWPIQK